ncbi:BPSS1780 family membrane protein [Aquabacterium sp.]|uniref:BPSS1780 family membrane protein n=1 Tax=Aquabacterium sp. TaxID=1872578 RepID=UPI0035B4C31B
MDGHNPYSPPSAAVGTPSRPEAADNLRFNPEGRSVPAGQGWAWFKSAWQIFKAQPLMFWVALVVMFIAIAVVSMIPLVNLLTMVATPAVVAGFGVCARSVQRTGRFELGQVFDGFRTRLGTQLLAGLLYLLAMVVGIGVMAVAFGATGMFSMFTGGLRGQGAAAATMGAMGGLFFLVYFVVIMVVGSTITFAPYIIQETQLSAPQAMAASMKGAFKNVPAFLVGLLVYIVLAIVASIPLFLGWLVLFPVLFLTVFVAYSEIYFD